MLTPSGPPAREDDQPGDPPRGHLWPHQEEAVEAAGKTLGEQDRATLVMACGTGKTRAAAELSARLCPSGNVLVVVPTLVLLTQTLREWQSTMGSAEVGRIVAVCSQHVLRHVRRLHRDLDPRRTVRDRKPAGPDGDTGGDPGTHVTRDPKQLTELLALPGRVTVACTYHSLPVLTAAHHEHGLRPWDLVVVDEAHRTAGWLGQRWSSVHDDEAVPARRRVYMTATPRIFTDRAATRTWSTGSSSDADAVASMDDPEIFGEIFYELPFGDAIEMGLLADYRLVVPVVREEEVQQLLERLPDTAVRYGPTGAAVSVHMLATQIALLRAAADLDLHRVITYHHLVEAARWFATLLPQALALLDATQRPPGRLLTAHVHGEQHIDQRERNVNLLQPHGPHAGKGDLVVLSNSRVLGEGIDVPAVDAVAFIDGRSSVIDIIQAIGRALRRGGRSDKTATILVPVFLAAGQDPHAALDAGRFATVWQVVRALRAHDGRLGAYLDAQRRQISQNPGGLATDLPDWLQVTGTSLPAGFADAITVRAVSEASLAWEEYYGAAHAYHAEHGHLDVPTDWCTPAGLPLARWIKSQRQADRLGLLSPRRRALLDTLGMIWEPRQAKWDRAIRHAHAYHAEHGKLDAPVGYLTEDGFRLGNWLHKQRTAAAAGRLSVERRSQLDEYDMTWATHDEAWQANLDRLRAYRREHGHANVPRTYTCEDGYKLGSWLERQRATRQRGRLDQTRKTLLTELGVSWAPHQDAWETGYRALTQFHVDHGHVRVPDRHITPDGHQLGRWLAKQRQAARRGTVPPERRQRLTDLGVELPNPQD